MSKEKVTITVKFKLTRWWDHKETLLEMCGMYSRCLKSGMKALVAQNELNRTLDKEEKKPSGLTISRQAMSKESPSNMRDSACNEVAATWKSYSALWDKQANRSFPTVNGDGYRFRMRERSLSIDHENKTLTISMPGKKMEFGFMGSKDMHAGIQNCKVGAFDVIKPRKDWYIRIFCTIDTKKRQNREFGPIITVHTGMKFCVCALAAYRNGAFRFIFVPCMPLWGVRKKHKDLRKSLQSKGKVRKVKEMGGKEHRTGSWYYHTVTKKLSQWISAQHPRQVIMGEHLGIRSKSKKGKLPYEKQKNYWMSNYAFRSLLDKLKYKLLMEGIEFETVDTVEEMTTRVCSKCGGETFGLKNRAGRLCKDCGKTISNEWNALKNLLPKSYRLMRRNRTPGTPKQRQVWHRLSIIESDLKRQLNSLCQKENKRRSAYN